MMVDNVNYSVKCFVIILQPKSQLLTGTINKICQERGAVHGDE